MQETRKRLTVGLLWHSLTSDNLGVGALTIGQMVLISEAARRRGAEVSFIVIGTRGGTPYPVEGFQVDGTGEFALRAFKAGRFDAIGLLRRCDIVFDIGEGDSFADIYGNKRLTIQVGAKVLVRAFGKPLILSPQTIGPFKSAIGRRLGVLAMHLARRIYARDHLSMAALSHAGMAHKAQEVIDVAFALPFDRPGHGDDSVTRVGINVSGLLYNGGYRGTNDFGLTVDYRVLVERVCRTLSERPDTEVHLVPHVISDAFETEDDLRASETLLARLPALKLAPRFTCPVAAKSYISGLDFFAGARMHACIAAFSSGVPVLPMAYSRKFNGLFNSLAYPHVLDCLETDTDRAYAQLIDAFEQREALAVAVAEGNRIARDKLEVYTHELAEQLPL